MNSRRKNLAAVFSLCLGTALGPFAYVAASHAADAPLGLEEAVSLSLGANDPSVMRFHEQADAERERAVAAGQLADPQIQFRAANVTLDNFRLDQDPMTQLQVGVRQALPRGQTLSLRRQRHLAQSDGATARASLEAQQRTLETRTAWLEIYYLRGAQQAVTDSQGAVRELVEVATSVFSTGRSASQDVLRAELELSALEERTIGLAGREALIRADLERLIGPEAAMRPLEAALPNLPPPLPRSEMRDRLASHPSVNVLDANVDASSIDVDIAEEAYRPAWSVEAMYGNRSTNRSDFASVGIVVDMPIFTGLRQDRRRAAAQSDRQAARLTRAAHLRDLERELNRTFAAWQRDVERAALYEHEVVPRAIATSEAVLAAYRNDVSDFPELIRSRLSELDAELALLRLRIDARQANARLMYLGGEGIYTGSEDDGS